MSECQMIDMVKEMGKLKSEFDIKWEVLVKYMLTQKCQDNVQAEYQSSAAGQGDLIAVEDNFENLKMSATVPTFNSH